MDNARRIWRQGLAANPQNGEFVRAAVEWFAAAGQQREALAVARSLARAAPALSSGWRLYRDSCARFAGGCVAEAEAGERAAATIYAIDLLPGQALPNGLFGRIVGE
jgi:hypothetical protein